MNIEKGLAIIKKWEGCRLSAYRCPAGVPTIGYGHTKGVKMGQTITQSQAEELLRQDIAVFCKYVDNYNKMYHFTENEYNALLSFTFNLGKGNLDQLTNYGKRSKSVIAEKMLCYVNAGGKPLNGLIARRKEENALFKRGDK